MTEAIQRQIDIVGLIDRPRLSRLQCLVILLCGVVAILDGFDAQAIAFVAPVIAGEFGVPASAFGPVFGIGLLGLTVGALTLGPVADRLGRKPVIIASTLVFGVFALPTTFSTTLTSLMVYRFLTGLGLGGAMPNVIALTSEYSPRQKRATLVTLMFCGFPLGAVLGGLVSARLITAYGWPAVFLLGGILPLLLSPFLWALLPESARFLIARGGRSVELLGITRRLDPASHYDADGRWLLDEETTDAFPVKELLRADRAIWTILLWIIFFCNLLILYFLINWLPTVLEKSGLPIERAIIATVVLNAGGIVGGLLLGNLVDRRAPFGILTTAYALAALLVAAIGMAAGVGQLMPIIFAAGFFVIGTQYCMNALAASLYPTPLRSTGVGWALGIGRIGSIIGPVIGGIILSLGWDTQELFIAAAIPALLSSVAVFLLGKNRQNNAAETPVADGAVLARSAEPSGQIH